MRRTDLILYCGILNLGLDIVLNLILMRWFGVAGIALATSLWTVSTFLFLWYWTRRLMPKAPQRSRLMHPPAQYLLRFDDLCPTMSRARWQPYLALIEFYGVRPILAVIPDNRDPKLELDEPDPEFWAKMRGLEVAGATIGLHGYRHLCQSQGRSLVPCHRATEFAGVPEETQRQWIRTGLKILRGHGLSPRIWVAPRHGFDLVTLRVLREEGIELLSDGLARLPFVRHGMTWIPQQLWAPQQKATGLWTILIHANTPPDSLIHTLDAYLKLHSAQFTSVDQAVATLHPAPLGLRERFLEELSLLRLKQRQMRKLLLGR